MTGEGGRAAREVVVRGLVQGVGFRYHCVSEAQRLGIVGWVRNDPDGSVTGHFEGDERSVDALVDWCRRGPAYAHVESVDVRPGSVTGASSFSVR